MQKTLCRECFVGENRQCTCFAGASGWCDATGVATPTVTSGGMQNELRIKERPETLWRLLEFLEGLGHGVQAFIDQGEHRAWFELSLGVFVSGGLSGQELDAL